MAHSAFNRKTQPHQRQPPRCGGRAGAVPAHPDVLLNTLPPPDNTEPPWYLVYSKPRQEFIAAEQLARQGYVAYLPVCEHRTKTGRKAAPAQPGMSEPMFPRYVFFRAGRTQQSLAPVRSTRGVCTLVSFGLGPVTVSPDVIEQVRHAEALRASVDRLNLPPMGVGDQVRLRNESLQALQGLVTAVAGERVTLLLNILGRDKLLKVHHSELELCGRTPPLLLASTL